MDILYTLLWQILITFYRFYKAFKSIIFKFKICFNKEYQVIEKKPEHIAIILNETNDEDRMMEEMNNVINYTIELGISYISFFYDYNNVDKINNKIIMKWNATKDEKGLLIRKKDKKIVLNTLCKSDILKEFKYMLNTVDKQQINLYDTIQNKIYEMNQPGIQLIISLNPTYSMYNFPPWKLRLAEICFLPNNTRLYKHTLQSCIVQYANTRQRFGQ